MDNLPWFRSLSWYFLVTSNYFFYGETLVEQFGVVVNKVDFLPLLVKYHRLISFSMYIMGNVAQLCENIDYFVCRVCLVRVVPGKEVLSPSVLSVCLDSRGSALRGHSVLSHRTEHVPGNILLHLLLLHYHHYLHSHHFRVSFGSSCL